MDDDRPQPPESSEQKDEVQSKEQLLGSSITAHDGNSKGNLGRGRGSAYVTRNLTEGSIPRTVWFLAWPQMVENGLFWASRLVDLILAGAIGFQSIAGVGVAQNYTEFAQMSRRGLDTSMSAMIARAVGAKDYALANHVALQAFTLSGIFSVLMMVVGLLFSEPLLRVIGITGGALSQGTDYLRVLLIGMGTMAFTRMSGAALGTSGDVMTPMRATMVARVIHIALAPFLVFGWWWFPSWGILGAAVANIVAQSISVVINFIALFAGTSRLHLNLRAYRFDYRLSRRLVVVGIPAGVTGTLRAVANLVISAVVVSFGEAPLAAYIIARRAEGMVHLVTDGLGAASGILVGQNLGARQPKRARNTVLWSVGFVTLLMVLVAGFVLIFPQLVALVFSRDPELVASTSTWLRIIALSYIALGIGQVLNESLNRAGDTGAVMLVNLMRYWAIEVPLAFLLAYVAGLDQWGVAWATVAAVWIRFMVYIPYFLWGRWLRIKLI